MKVNKKVFSIIYFTLFFLCVSASMNPICQFLTAYEGYTPKEFYTLVRDIIDNTTTILDDNNDTFIGGVSRGSYEHEMAFYNKTAYRLNAIIENLPVPLVRLLRSSTGSCDQVERLYRDGSGDRLSRDEITPCKRGIITIVDLICEIADVASLPTRPGRAENGMELNEGENMGASYMDGRVRTIFNLLSDLDHAQLGLSQYELGPKRAEQRVYTFG